MLQRRNQSAILYSKPWQQASLPTKELIIGTAGKPPGSLKCALSNLRQISMSATPSPIVDAFSTLANAETQHEAAQLAQDVFSEIFRKAFNVAPELLGKALIEAETRSIEWCQKGASSEEQLLRLAMLITGLDQWGMAYTQTFSLTAIPALSALIAALRNRLSKQSNESFQRLFTVIDQIETNVVDFKVELRRSIHLALWHAMAACETEEDAESIIKPLGGMLLGLNQLMPELGWRLIADTLAHIQVQLLSETSPLSDLAHQSTQKLFESLQHAMPREQYQTILRHASQAALAWQQAHRTMTTH